MENDCSWLADSCTDCQRYIELVSTLIFADGNAKLEFHWSDL